MIRQHERLNNQILEKITNSINLINSNDKLKKAKTLRPKLLSPKQSNKRIQRNTTSDMR
jgi:hypothetical protein